MRINDALHKIQRHQRFTYHLIENVLRIKREFTSLLATTDHVSKSSQHSKAISGKTANAINTLIFIALPPLEPYTCTKFQSIYKGTECQSDFTVDHRTDRISNGSQLDIRIDFILESVINPEPDTARGRQCGKPRPEIIEAYFRHHIIHVTLDLPFMMGGQIPYRQYLVYAGMPDPRRYKAIRGP